MKRSWMSFLLISIIILIGLISFDFLHTPTLNDISDRIEKNAEMQVVKIPCEPPYPYPPPPIPPPVNG